MKIRQTFGYICVRNCFTDQTVTKKFLRIGETLCKTALAYLTKPVKMHHKFLSKFERVEKLDDKQAGNFVSDYERE